MPIMSDLMNIYSSSNSFDTWSHSRDDGEDDDDDEASWPVRYVRDGNYDTRYDMQHIQMHQRRRRRTKEVTSFPDDNSIVESTAGLNETRSTDFNRTRTSGSHYSKDSTKNGTEEVESRGRVRLNPFDDSSGTSTGSQPSDEIPQSRKIRDPRQRWQPKNTIAPNLHNTDSLLDEESVASRPLTPVQEDSLASASYVSSQMEQPTDEQGPHGNAARDVAISAAAREAQAYLRRTFDRKRQATRDALRKSALLQQERDLRRSKSSQSSSAESREQSALSQKERDLRWSKSSRSQESREQSTMPQKERDLRWNKSYQSGESLVRSVISQLSSDKNQSHSTEETVSSANTSADDIHDMGVDQHLALHDLCSEATSPDDVAWRNAIYLLATQPELATATEDGWSPLHVCCLGSAPPPDFMVRAILYCHSQCAQAVDKGGRLPLHMIAASSADSTIMQLLVEEYPNAVYKTDERGLTPLHMLMRNDGVELTMDRVRILLGQTAPRKRAQKSRILQRRGQHLDLNVDEVNRMARGGTGDLDFESDERDQRHERHVSHYPEDVQVSFQKLGQWKRLQKRLHNNADKPPIDIDLAFSLENEERNPAAIAAPPNMQLPIHMAVLRKDPADESFEDEDEDEAFDVRNPPANQNEIMQVIVSAYPRGLVTRNSKGYTPLMVALLNQDCLPSLELLQLLLGMRTSGYETAPEWANDLPLHESQDGRYANPAMVPSVDTNQLPLHVAAEEMPSFYAAIESIHASYPGAVVAQDVRGRTPLHMALRNYQKIQPDPKVVSLLLTEKVAQIRDDDGFLPFDLLVGGAHNLPKEEPTLSLWEDSTFDPSSVYKKFFIFVVMQAPRPRNRTESLAFLQRLRRLPPWIRRQACTVGFVQDMLIEEMASMGKCALIISSGITWVVLLTCFRLQVDEYTKTGAAASQYAPVIYLLTSTVLLFQVVNWCISASLSVFVNQCLLNIWPWIDLASASLTIASSAMIQGESSDSTLIASLSTAATGFLWFSLIGYLARWWHGMAVFMGRSLRLSHALIWPLLAAVILIVAFSQMLFTFNLITAQEECDNVLGGRSLCTIREAFITAYLMLLGTPLIDTTEETAYTLNSGSVILISLFTALLVLFIVSLLISVVSEALRIDLDEVALGYFWEPKLNFAFMVDDLASCCSRSNESRIDGVQKRRLMPRHSFGERVSAALEDAWTVVDYGIFGGERRRGNMWYVAYCGNKKSSLVAWPLRMSCLIIAPIWLVLGLATCGLLWPPQVRRWLFRPARSSVRSRRESNAAAEYASSQVAGMRGDVLQLKTMSYERSNDVRQEIHELKELLHAAMAD